ncbi:MFS transporter [Dictyobacter alpinus]|uniref:MFS transporter n=1 Tax=Dictyobacter alpinus TaxID=2014873 RepID=A0A402BFD1_9CHLR|nr:MFS transporter [Dictyobacter alpinus]GCE29957.1 MFS transporter [Dictyobacter alpinus]
MLATLRQRNFVLLFLGGLISQMGDWLLKIGLPVYIYTLTSSALATSITLIISFLPTIVLGSLAGVFVDRWDRRRTMLVANMLQGLGLLPLLLVSRQEDFWLLYLVLFFESCASQFVLPAESALIPSLVPEENLLAANALKSSSSYVARLLGAALGGILLGQLGLHTVVLLNAASFFFVCLMLWLIRLPAAPPQLHSSSTPVAIQVDGLSFSPSLMNVLSSGTSRLVNEWLEGLSLIRTRPILLMLLSALCLTGLGEGIFGVLLIVFVQRVLHGDAVVYGALLSIQMVGNLLGTICITPLHKHASHLLLCWTSFLLFGIIDLLIIDIPIVYPGLWLVFVLFVLVGIPGTIGFVSMQTLFQTLVDDTLRGRIFGTMLSVNAMVSLVGMLIAGTLGDRLGPVILLNFQGGTYIASGLLLFFAFRFQSTRSPVTDVSGAK